MNYNNDPPPSSLPTKNIPQDIFACTDKENL